MAYPTLSAFPPIPNRNAPEADFDTKMYTLFTYHRDVLVPYLEAIGTYLETESTIVGGLLDATIIGSVTPAAGSFTTLDVPGSGDRAITIESTNGQAARLRLIRSAGNSYEVVNDGGKLRFKRGLAGVSDTFVVREISPTEHIWYDPATGSERMRIDSAGNVGIGIADPFSALHVESDSTAEANFRFGSTNASFNRDTIFGYASRAASDAYNLIALRSGGPAGDLEGKFTGDGNWSVDGTNTSGGADYAEWWEGGQAFLDWLATQPDLNPAGISVVLDTVNAKDVLANKDWRARVALVVGDDEPAIEAVLARISAGNVRSYIYIFCDADGKMRLPGLTFRPATWLDDPEDILGVISANPSVVGDGDMDRWKGKYLRDDFRAYTSEEYEVLEWVEEGSKPGSKPVTHSYPADAIPDGLSAPPDATSTIQSRRVLNPAYDPENVYISREDRPEWATVGLMGKLRLRKGQPVGSRWVKMRDVSPTIEEWLVR